MSRLKKHEQALYEIRFSPMCKPAAEVANLTQLESHSVRSRTMMMWRISAGHIKWDQREVEILYESTLDSISEAFDVFHYPISQYMLDARADVWEAGLAPQNVKDVVENTAQNLPEPSPKAVTSTICLAGEIFQLEDERYLETLKVCLDDIPVWSAPTGVLPYVLGAREVALVQAKNIVKGVIDSKAKTVIVDGAETAWGLLKVYADLGIKFPKDINIQLLSEYLMKHNSIEMRATGKALIHDSRPACLIAKKMPTHLAVMPGYSSDEVAFGEGLVFDAPRQLLENAGVKSVFGNWTRCLARSCGVDDGLWLTYENLAEGLVRQRLAYAKELGAEIIVTSSPLCAHYLAKHANEDDPSVFWLPELIGS